MVIQYAQKKSNAVALLDGTYLSEEKRSQQQQQQENRETGPEVSELKRKATECKSSSFSLSFFPSFSLSFFCFVSYFFSTFHYTFLVLIPST